MGASSEKEPEVCNEAKRETHTKKAQTEVCASGDSLSNYTTLAVACHQLPSPDNTVKSKEIPGGHLEHDDTLEEF